MRTDDEEAIIAVALFEELRTECLVDFVGTLRDAGSDDSFDPIAAGAELLHRSDRLVGYASNRAAPSSMRGAYNSGFEIGERAEEYYAALKMRGIPTALIRFEGEFHGTSSKPSNFMRTQLYMMSWYNKYRRTGNAVTTVMD